MAEGGNKCNGQCHPIYRTDGHIKRSVADETFLGSKHQFCAAFYHVHKWDTREHYCLEPKCIIGQRATNENNPCVQARTVVAVVKFEDENRKIQYQARYTNCYKKSQQKHAEDFFKEDIEKRKLRKKVEANPNGTITLYLTYQPCNKSTGTANTKRNQSCCTTLRTIYESILQKHTISLCVKAANTCRLIVNDEDTNDAKEDVDEEIDEDSEDEKKEKRRKNAVRGIKRLMRIGVNVSGMTKKDWDYLLDMTNLDVPRKYHARRKDLDKSVQKTFTDIKAQLKKQSSSKKS